MPYVELQYPFMGKLCLPITVTRFFPQFRAWSRRFTPPIGWRLRQWLARRAAMG